jgi:hypothetical protein
MTPNSQELLAQFVNTSKTAHENSARAKYEKKHGKLARGTDVDHKNNNHDDDSASNLRPLSHGKNTAKENKRRAGKKSK